MKIKNLTSEEIQEIKQLRDDLLDNIINLGKLELQIQNTKKILESLNQSKEELIIRSESLSNIEDSIHSKLKEKYGEGTINLETGEITISNNT